MQNTLLMNAEIGEVVSKVESELLCRAFIYLYLRDDPFNKDAKEKFGMLETHSQALHFSLCWHIHKPYTSSIWISSTLRPSP